MRLGPDCERARLRHEKQRPVVSIRVRRHSRASEFYSDGADGLLVCGTRLIKPRMAQVVLLGANVGTAVTAWIVATGIEWVSPALLFVGIILYRGGSTSRQGAGTALLGIALMLLSLHLLSNATEPLRRSPALAAFIGLLENAWPVAMIFSAAIAFASSSSLAAVVLILSLTSTGILWRACRSALVLGANFGGAIPPVIASLSASAAARRVTLGNLIVRAIGCLLILPVADIFGQLAFDVAGPSVQTSRGRASRVKYRPGSPGHAVFPPSCTVDGGPHPRVRTG